MRFEEFKKRLSENFMRRSRTAQSGITKAGDGVRGAKKAVEKIPSEVEKIVLRNTEETAKFLWGTLSRRQLALSAKDFREISECTYEILQKDLARTLSYSDEQDVLRTQGDLWAKKTNLLHEVHPHYRVWEVSYAEHNPHPLEIEIWMNVFYSEMAKKIMEYHNKSVSLECLLAWTDRELDFIIHPWIDGCGRHATAFMMFICLLVNGKTLPSFGSREEHYKAIKTLESHKAYYRECLKRKI